jgi:hypothetical protein
MSFRLIDRRLFKEHLDSSDSTCGKDLDISFSAIILGCNDDMVTMPITKTTTTGVEIYLVCCDRYKSVSCRVSSIEERWHLVCVDAHVSEGYCRKGFS